MATIGSFKQYLMMTTNMNHLQANRIIKSFGLKKVARGTQLVNHGEICKEFYFVASGCIRTYFLTSAGQQRTRLIALEGSACTVLSSFVGQTPSAEFADALEDSELYAISYKNFRRLLAEIPGWLEFYTKFLEMAYVHQHEKLQDLVTLTATERYEKLISTRPEYVQRLSNKILASYLDIREETLSRVKSKYAFLT